MSSRTQLLPTAEILEQLHRILQSPHFRNSRRSSDFLQHVVQASCEGRVDALKERSVGVAVFQREPDYDTNQDPIVRNTAGQVRKRLAQYYHDPGHDRELRINLPPGSYAPEITPPNIEEPAPTSVPREESGKQWNRRWKVIGGSVVLTVLGLLAVFWLRTRDSAVDEFWNPVLKSMGPVMVVVGQGHTYKLPIEIDQAFESGTAGQSKRTIPLADVVPAWDRYVALTDAQAVIRIASLFTRRDKEFTLLGGRNAALSDLRRRPAVLIGGFNNEWTLRLTGELRFFFETDTENKAEVVRDRLHPDKRDWRVPLEATTPRIATDYAIVSRVHNGTTEQTVVVAAGIRGGGTSAAGEFLTNPAYLASALVNAPKGWQDKNVQFVLATQMFSGNPAPPTVVAAHFW